jgi:DnaJ-class molecular chaperone
MTTTTKGDTMKCERCKGAGRIWDSLVELSDCPDCLGDGKVDPTDTDDREIDAETPAVKSSLVYGPDWRGDKPGTYGYDAERERQDLANRGDE